MARSPAVPMRISDAARSCVSPASGEQEDGPGFGVTQRFMWVDDC